MYTLVCTSLYTYYILPSGIGYQLQLHGACKERYRLRMVCKFITMYTRAVMHVYCVHTSWVSKTSLYFSHATYVYVIRLFAAVCIRACNMYVYTCIHRFVLICVQVSYTPVFRKGMYLI